MTFPNTVEEFMEQYKIVDTEQIYTNGSELVPIFRMKQWFDHKPERKKGEWIPCSERFPEEDGYYIVYAPCYFFGSSSGKENHNGIMFSLYKNGKWSIEHGYYKRPNCVKAWMPLPEPWKGDNDE